MPFGIKSAQEVFQKRMSQLLGDLQGVETDIYDILVWGTNQEEHDKRLRAVLDRCEQINLTLNRDIELMCPECKKPSGHINSVSQRFLTLATF